MIKNEVEHWLRKLCLIFVYLSSNCGKWTTSIVTALTFPFPHRDAVTNPSSNSNSHDCEFLWDKAVSMDNEIIGLDSNPTLNSEELIMKRRSFLRCATTGTTLGLLGCSTFPSLAVAAVDVKKGTVSASPEGKEEGGLLSASKVADALRGVPTFTIVDSTGIPYMVVGEDAKVTGYFFTSYDETERILQAAKESVDRQLKEAKKAKQKTDIEENPWNDAMISTVPLDFAVTLVSKTFFSARRGSGNYFYIAPSEQDIEDALQITGKSDLAEGKVPIFYIEDFTILAEDGKTKQSPVYFSKAQLEEDYKKAMKDQGSETDLPKIMVSELFAILRELVKPGGANEDLKDLIFVPPKDTIAKAKKCPNSFVLGKRNLVL